VLVEEAGGRVTDRAGRPPAGKARVVTSNNLVHDEVLALLSEPDEA
jgi:fructose-1,6-bisphosphatase/inositol monophosphatase family enzyme